MPDKLATVIPFQQTKDVPRIQDLKLGEVLGFSRAREIRKLIARHVKEKNLNDYDVRATVAREEPRAGSPFSDSKAAVIEYWLTEEAALFVAARSETAAGTQILKQLIAIFDEARRQSGAVSRMLAQYFNDAPVSIRERLFAPLIAALLKMRGEDESVTNPPWGQILASHVYRWALIADGQQEHRRKLNPNPGGTAVDYAWFSAAGESATRRIINTGVDSTRACRSWDEWRHKMEVMFGRGPLQLEMSVPIRHLPSKGAR